MMIWLVVTRITSSILNRIEPQSSNEELIPNKNVVLHPFVEPLIGLNTGIIRREATVAA